MQQSRYPVFYDKDTPIELSFPWQCSPTLLLSVFYHWNSEHLLYLWLVYKTSSYTVIYIIDKDNFY